MLANAVHQLADVQLTQRIREQARSHIWNVFHEQGGVGLTDPHNPQANKYRLSA